MRCKRSWNLCLISAILCLQLAWAFRCCGAMAAGLSVCLVWRALCLAVAGGSAELHVLFSGGALGAGGADHRYDDAAENVHVYLDAVHVPENLQILILSSRSHALRFFCCRIIKRTERVSPLTEFFARLIMNT